MNMWPLVLHKCVCMFLMPLNVQDLSLIVTSNHSHKTRNVGSKSIVTSNYGHENTNVGSRSKYDRQTFYTKHKEPSSYSSLPIMSSMRYRSKGKKPSLDLCIKNLTRILSMYVNCDNLIPLFLWLYLSFVPWRLLTFSLWLGNHINLDSVLN